MFLNLAPNLCSTSYRAHLTSVKSQSYRYLFWGIITFYLLLSQSLQAVAITTLTDETNVISKQALGIQFMEDANNHYTFDQILSGTLDQHFITAPDKHLSFGFSQSTYWLKLDIQYYSNIVSQKDWLLELGYPQLDQITLFTPQEDGSYSTYETGDAFEFKNRQFEHINFLFKISTSNEKIQTFYLKIKSNSAIELPIFIWDQDEFLVHSNIQQIVYGLFYGFAIAMILYNLFLYTGIRDPSYLFYAFYITCFVTVLAMVDGHAYQYLWPEQPWWTGRGVLFIAAASTIWSLLFTKHFLKTAKTFPLGDKILKWGLAFSVFCMVFTIISTQRKLVGIVLIGYGSLMTLTTLLVGIGCLLKDYRPARYFIYAYGAFFTGILISSLRAIDILPINIATLNAPKIGSAMEILLLSLALADRINEERRARLKALAAQNETKSHLINTEKKLIHSAFHDSLTGLPNLAGLQHKGPHIVQQARQKEQEFATFIIYLSNFREINNTLGRTNGDKLLQMVTQRLHDTLKSIDASINLEREAESPSYVALTESVTYSAIIRFQSIQQIKQAAELINSALKQPFQFKGMSLTVSTQIGISLYPEHGQTFDTLIRNAHIAMGHAISQHETFTFFDHNLDTFSSRRLSLMGELEQAIEQDTLELYFQPQVNFQSERVEGVEALLRWNHPELGFIPPDEFIVLAEQSGTIKNLTYWVLNSALEQLADLNRRGYPLTMSVNLSATNLLDPDISNVISKLLTEHEVTPNQLILELTETAMMEDPHKAQDVLVHLTRLGLHVSIDDFGTGYSSLAYLKQLPVSEIKIDRSFITDLTVNEDDVNIVSTTLSMGHNFGLKVVAEGIEDRETFNMLKDMGCDLAQGYFLSKPICMKDLIIWLDKRVGRQRLKPIS